MLRDYASVYAAQVLHPNDGVLELQFPTLQLGELEIISRRMLEGFRKFRLQHPMPLFEFSKRERGHVAILLMSDFCLTMTVCHDDSFESTAIPFGPDDTVS